MDYKRYMLMELVGDWNSVESLKLRIRNGMLTSDVDDVLKVRQDWTPGANERLYFFPGCSVPRFKVREKFSVTIKPKNATAAFVAAETMQGSETMFDQVRNLSVYPSKLIGQWLVRVYGKDHQLVVKFKSLILNCEDVVLIDSKVGHILHWRVPEDHTFDIKKSMNDMADKQGIDLSELPEESLYHTHSGTTIGDLQCPIYSQDCILQLLNDGSIVISENKYDELRMMARSEDNENIILVMELMANSDYDKSFLYLLLLLKEFADKFKLRRELHHVNFKGLLHYFELDERKFNTSLGIEALTKTMQKLGKFTRHNVQRLTQLYGNSKDLDNLNEYQLKIQIKAHQSDNYQLGPVLKPEAEHLLDDDIVSDADDIVIPQDQEDSINI